MSEAVAVRYMYMYMIGCCYYVSGGCEINALFVLILQHY